MRTRSLPEPVQPSLQPALSIAFILCPNFTLQAFSGFVEVLRHAADVGDRSRQVRCRWTIMGPTLAAVRASCGVEVLPWEAFAQPRDFDYVVVVGGLLPEHREYDGATLEYLRSAAATGVTLVGVCTGSFVLAQAGLMRGRRCCVHWYHHRDFLAAYPDSIPVTDELFLIDRDRITCGGGASVVDLAVHLVERHCGRDRALKSLRYLLLDWARPPQHPQLPFTIEYSSIPDSRVRKAVFLMEQNMSPPLPVERIAGEAAASVRQLERLFRDQLGESPSSYYRAIRLKYGRWLLTQTDRPIAEIAYECGFANASHFSRCFKAAFGRTPASARPRGPALT